LNKKIDQFFATQKKNLCNNNSHYPQPLKSLVTVSFL